MWKNGKLSEASICCMYSVTGYQEKAGARASQRIPKLTDQRLNLTGEVSRLARRLVFSVCRFLGSNCDIPREAFGSTVN